MAVEVLPAHRACTEAHEAVGRALDPVAVARVLRVDRGERPEVLDERPDREGGARRRLGDPQQHRRDLAARVLRHELAVVADVEGRRQGEALGQPAIAELVLAVQVLALHPYLPLAALARRQIQFEVEAAAVEVEPDQAAAGLLDERLELRARYDAARRLLPAVVHELFVDDQLGRLGRAARDERAVAVLLDRDAGRGRRRGRGLGCCSS